MTNGASRSYWQRERFPSLYVVQLCFQGVHRTTEQMRKIIREDVIKYDLVYKDFIGSYLKLIDALESLTEALFELCPDGVVKFELTREHGIKMLFKTKMSSEGKIFTVIDVGWVYSNQVTEIVEESLSKSYAALEQMVSK